MAPLLQDRVLGGDCAGSLERSRFSKLLTYSREEERMATLSAFAKKLAKVTEDEHKRFQLLDEADPVLCKQIKKYWTDLGFPFESCVSVPWSAVFVSWCVKQAGATGSEFKFAPRHSSFVHAAIQNALNGVGVFHGLDIASHPPGVGDIIQNNRNGTTHDFVFARTHENYQSHSAIVAEIGEDAVGRYALTIGGNEGNSIRRTVVRLTPQGFIKQRKSNPFISVIKNLK